MSLANTITLNWTDPKSISDLAYPGRSEAGVYVWGFTIDNVFIPYYVGIADNLLLRIQEHISSILSGRYTIFHRDSLANFKNFKDQDVQKDKSKGKIYSPNWPHNYKSFLDGRKELQPHIDFMIDAFSFFYAVVNRELVSGQELKHIEKTCINHIGKENLANTRAGYSDKFIVSHIGNTTRSGK